jgi:hypothetical protein
MGRPTPWLSGLAAGREPLRDQNQLWDADNPDSRAESRQVHLQPEVGRLLYFPSFVGGFLFHDLSFGDEPNLTFVFLDWLSFLCLLVQRSISYQDVLGCGVWLTLYFIQCLLYI